MARCSGIAPCRKLLALAAIVVAGVAAYVVGGHVVDALLYLLPALLLLVVLATRSYPGEGALLAAIGRARHRGRTVGAGLLVSPPRLRALLPRGGRLIAFSLAERPPPAPAGVSLT